jgi:hypothetical protein
LIYGFIYKCGGRHNFEIFKEKINLYTEI